MCIRDRDATVQELVASPIEPLGEALSDLQATDPTGLAVELSLIHISEPTRPY